MANEAGDTLQPTPWSTSLAAARGPNEQAWQNRAHFFGAAAEAMRRILVETRAKKQGSNAAQRGARRTRRIAIVIHAPPDELLAVNEALDTLAAEDPAAPVE